MVQEGHLKEEDMFLFRVFGRVLVVTIGIALQIVIAVQSPTTLRLVQRIADTANDTLTEALPDAYAVWVDMVGADTIFVHLIFICIAIVGVELLARLWKKYFSSKR